MDFKLVLDNLLTRFKVHNVRYALIGGFALGAHGVVRATVDIDFLVSRDDDMASVGLIMHELGYECSHQTENVSQFIAPLKIFGEVYFLHAFREISVGMIKRTEEKMMFNETLAVRILKIEDLIGLKVQAMANDERRKAIDLADIEAVVALHKTSLNWNTVEEYFSLFGFEKLFAELKDRYRHAQ
jgi:hypothetical protein